LPPPYQNSGYASETVHVAFGVYVAILCDNQQLQNK